MDEKLELLFEQAPCFDEGSLRQSDAYKKIAQQRMALEDLFTASYGQQIWPLLERYGNIVFSEVDLVARHYFVEGYRAAAAGRSHQEA